MEWETPVEVLREHLKTMSGWKAEAEERLAKAEEACDDAEKAVRAEKLEIERLDGFISATTAAIKTLEGR